jgi:hypothetical protein
MKSIFNLGTNCPELLLELGAIVKELRENVGIYYSNYSSVSLELGALPRLFISCA